MGWSPRELEKAERLYDDVVAGSNSATMRASRIARDVARSCPPVVDQVRRGQACASLRFFLETYFKQTFHKPWSPDHMEVIGRLQHAIETGGQYALAMARATGKTSLTERAAIWAILTGRRRFIVVACASESLAEGALARLKQELEFNDLLVADFPRAVYPIRRLEHQARRCVGQLWEGKRTGIVWTKKRLCMPTVPGSEASGAVVHVLGLTSAVRGLSHTLMDGHTIRPDILLVDDPSDREAARSVVQTNARLSILNADLMGLGGPGQKLAALCTCTIIYKNDMADQLLDHTRSPSWAGSVYRLVYDWPERMDMWQCYKQLRTDGLKPGGNKQAHLEYLKNNFEEMHRGSKVGWESRFNADQLSALQHAFDLRMDRGEAAFMSEYMNQPIDDTKLLEALNAGKIAQRCNGFPRGVAPPEVEKLVAAVDVGQYAHWWVVAGFSESFGCSIVDYGVFPEQRSRIFDSRSLSPTLETLFSGGVDAQVHGGLKAVVSMLMGREWRRSDGASLPISRVLIDSGWRPDVVRLFIRSNEHKNLLIPSKGIGVGATSCPMADYPRKTGEKKGDFWVYGKADQGDKLRLLKLDSNGWKSRVSDALTCSVALKSAATLFGTDVREHELVASHLASEFPVLVEASGRKIHEWRRRPDFENHWLDTLVMAFVAASFEGLAALGSLGPVPVEPKKPRQSFSELQRRAQERRRAAGGYP